MRCSSSGTRCESLASIACSAALHTLFSSTVSVVPLLEGDGPVLV
jgi:hypothetical protein